MTGKVNRSTCCKAEVRIDGIPDFLGSKEVCTVSFICRKCGRPCDVAEPKERKLKSRVAEKSNVEKIVTTKTRIVLEEKRSMILQKLIELLDGITIDPVEGVILTPEKKRQVAEFQKMEQDLFRPKIKRSRE